MQLTPATARGIAIRTGGTRSRRAISTTPRSTSATARGTSRTCSQVRQRAARARRLQRRARGTSTVARATASRSSSPETRAYVDARRAPEDASTAKPGAAQARTRDRRPGPRAGGEREHVHAARADGRARSSPTGTCCGWGRVDEPGWNVAQRFRLGPTSSTRCAREIHAHLRARGRRPARGRWARRATPGGPGRAAARARARRRRSRPARVGMVLTEPPRQVRRGRRGEAGRDRRGRVRRGGADRRRRVRDEPPSAAASSPSGRTRDLPRVPRRRAGRARVGVVRRARRDAVRRRDAAGGARAGRVSRARRGALGGCGRARDAGARHAGGRAVAADPRAARLPRGLHDPRARSTRRLASDNRACGSRRRRTTRSGRWSSSPRPATGPSRASGIAQAQAIPIKFLENILVDLRHAGLVESQRGAEGGYWLARPAAEINLAQVIRAVDGPLANVRGRAVGAARVRGLARSRCARSGSRCARACGGVLEAVTLADVARGKLPRRRRRALAADPDAWATALA